MTSVECHPMNCQSGSTALMLRCSMILIFCSCSVNGSTIFKCTDENGRIRYSDQPCNDGEQIQYDEPRGAGRKEAPTDRLRKAREYNEAVSFRLTIARLEREAAGLEAKRRRLVRERDAEVKRLRAILLDTYTYEQANAVKVRLYEVQQAYGKQIAVLESDIFRKHAEIAAVRSARKNAQHSQPKSNVLDRASSGKCSLYITGEETALSFRIYAKGYEPGEVIETISRSGDEVIRNEKKVSPEGAYETLVLPRIAGQSSGKASFTITGKNCSLTVRYKWHMP